MAGDQVHNGLKEPKENFFEIKCSIIEIQKAYNK
jgi:hypothetical protein